MLYAALYILKPLVTHISLPFRMQNDLEALSVIGLIEYLQDGLSVAIPIISFA